MPNIVITNTAESVRVEFNDKAPVVGVDQLFVSRSNIHQVAVAESAALVKLMMGTPGSPFATFEFSWDDTNAPQVDSVGGVAPTSNADLAIKIASLMLH